MNRDKVVLVDENNTAIAEMDKMEAHRKGALHRAFSIFIFNEKNEMLLQQRSAGKYHGAGLWSNTCCSHPQWQEDVKESAIKRLAFEMGLHCEIESRFSFLYKTSVENNLIEHELDHVFTGTCNQVPQPNPEEVQAFKWMSVPELLKDMELNPHCYTFWFKKALPVLLEKI